MFTMRVVSYSLTTDRLRNAWDKLRDASTPERDAHNAAWCIASDYAERMGFKAYNVVMRGVKQFMFTDSYGDVMETIYIDRLNDALERTCKPW